MFLLMRHPLWTHIQISSSVPVMSSSIDYPTISSTSRIKEQISAQPHPVIVVNFDGVSKQLKMITIPEQNTKITNKAMLSCFIPHLLIDDGGRNSKPTFGLPCYFQARARQGYFFMIYHSATPSCLLPQFPHLLQAHLILLTMLAPSLRGKLLCFDFCQL